MLFTSLVYNAALAVLEAAFLHTLRLRPTLSVALRGLIVPVGLGALMAVMLVGCGMFLTVRLAAYLVFVHGPLVFGACAWVLRKTSAAAAMLFGLLAMALAAVGLFAFLVEPYRLEVSRVRIETPKVTRPVRIVVLADLQTDVIGEHERAALRRAMEERPDLILMAGDYLQVSDRHEPRLRDELRALFREVRFGAPLGVYAVEGNVDGPSWPEIFDGIDGKAFVGTSRVERGGLAITGLSLRDSFNEALSVPAADGFHIAVGHAPDFALGKVQADLLVAGHTHGGQVRLPGIGPLVTLSAVPRAWAAGVTKLDGGRTLVVSRGVGMERGAAPRLRFLCRPEIVVIDVEPHK